jgi:hypothetical protein
MVARRRLAFLGVAAVVLVLSGACGTGASSPDVCRAIEDARCNKAPGCGISLEPPYSTSGTDVEACVRYYDVACLHGLEVSNPGQTEVNDCVRAINTHGCAVVMTPQNDPACAWLVPSASASTPDATADTAAAATPDAGVDAPEDSAEDSVFIPPL